VDALGNTSPVVQTLENASRDYITTQSFQFTADIAAVGPFGRGYRRVKFVFDISEGAPKIIYRQDLSRLGWALGEKAAPPGSRRKSNEKCFEINFSRRKKLTSLLGLNLDGNRLEGVVLRRTNGSLQLQQTFSVTLSLDPSRRRPNWSDAKSATISIPPACANAAAWWACL